jgi:U3 small nucleolar RNA-associated protein 21
LRALEKDFEPKTAPLPGSAVKSSESEIEDSEQIEDDEEFSSPEQIADALVTLSLLPDSRWKNLLSLDAIKVSYLDLTLVRFIIIVCIYFNLLTETKQA